MVNSPDFQSDYEGSIPSSPTNKGEFMKYKDGYDTVRKDRADKKRLRIRRRNLYLVSCGGMK